MTTDTVNRALTPRALEREHARFDAARAAFVKSTAQLDTFTLEMYGKYGSRDQRSWWLRGEIARYERLRAAQDRAGNRVFDIVVKVSPRVGWSTNAPWHWIAGMLSWEDATTRGQIAAEIPIPYGHHARDIERFRASIGEELTS